MKLQLNIYKGAGRWKEQKNPTFTITVREHLMAKEKIAHKEANC